MLVDRARLDERGFRERLVPDPADDRGDLPGRLWRRLGRLLILALASGEVLKELLDVGDAASVLSGPDVPRRLGCGSGGELD
jgi:hypothetical protein